MKYPGAIWRPLPENRTEPLIRARLLILHSAVAKADSLFGYFNSPGINVESHLYVQADGDTEQYISWDRQADANSYANGFALSVETWDNRDPDRVSWTPAQMNRLVDIAVQAHHLKGIPLVRATRWDGSGIGGHSDFPGKWTTVKGKTCPGLARRPQVAEIITRARDIVNGKPIQPAPQPVPPPQPEPTGDTPMPPTIAEGARGDVVRRLQGLLIAVRHSLDAEGGMDGIFGPGLKREVQAFQQARGLQPDGIVGPATWRRLILG